MYLDTFWPFLAVVIVGFMVIYFSAWPTRWPSLPAKPKPSQFWRIVKVLFSWLF